MSSTLLKSHLRSKLFENINLTIRANDEWMRHRLASRNAQGATIWQRLDNELRLAEEQWQHRLATAALRQRYHRLRLRETSAERGSLPSPRYWASRLLHVGKVTRPGRERSMLGRF